MPLTRSPCLEMVEQTDTVAFAPVLGLAGMAARAHVHVDHSDDSMTGDDNHDRALNADSSRASMLG
jgi:hypothetical protein